MVKEKILGVLGGMGPEATLDFLQKILDLAPAEKDQDHIKIIVNNDPKVPDRTNAILHNGPSPLPFLEENSRMLENCGADLIAVPCNTAHYWLKEIRDTVEIPIMDMIQETASFLEEKGIKKVALLSTTATAKTGLYHEKLDFLEIITPRNMDKVMKGIKKIKAEEKKAGRNILLEITSQLLERGAERVIAGCTEIPLVLTSDDAPLIDPVRILAKRVITLCKP